MKSWLQDNGIKLCSAHRERKSVATERFITTLKNKVDKYMPSISQKVYTDKLVDIVNEYNNTYHRTIKMKPIDIKSSTCIDFDKKNNKKDPKFEVGENVRISKYKKDFLPKIMLQIHWTEFL